MTHDNLTTDRTPLWGWIAQHLNKIFLTEDSNRSVRISHRQQTFIAGLVLGSGEPELSRRDWSCHYPSGRRWGQSQKYRRTIDDTI